MPENDFYIDNALDKKALSNLNKFWETAESAIPALSNTDVELLPKNVDLSQYLYYIRRQYGGCWGYATLAVWDIMNEIVCPYSPNLSFRLWRTFHSRPELSEKQNDVYRIFSPDGRFHTNTKGEGYLEWGSPSFFQSFGCTTEGTEPTLHGFPCLWPEGGWSREGVNEAYNYRLEAEPRKIKISSDEFMRWLVDSHPIRIEGGVHVVAVVGYDRTARTFKFVNSAGDKWGNNGYGTFTFDQLNNHQHLWFLGGAVTKAYIFEKWKNVPPPKPVPAARIAFKHSDRANVQLWLSVEDSPHPRNKIWSHGWNDESQNLCLTVRLPSEFIWPPTKNNRLVLDLYDSGTFSNSGGTIEEFTVAFGGHVVKSSELSKGSVSFKMHEHLKLIIP